MSSVTAAERILDASVVAAAYFTEVQSASARAIILAGRRFCAPDLLLLEVANIAAKKFRRGEVDAALAEAAVDFARRIVGGFYRDEELANQALSLASRHGFTSYDACYLVLADRLGFPVVTADLRLVERARSCGLGGLVEPLF